SRWSSDEKNATWWWGSRSFRQTNRARGGNLLIPAGLVTQFPMLPIDALWEQHYRPQRRSRGSHARPVHRAVSRKPRPSHSQDAELGLDPRLRDRPVDPASDG